MKGAANTHKHPLMLFTLASILFVSSDVPCKDVKSAYRSPLSDGGETCCSDSSLSVPVTDILSSEDIKELEDNHPCSDSVLQVVNYTTGLVLDTDDNVIKYTSGLNCSDPKANPCDCHHRKSGNLPPLPSSSETEEEGEGRRLQSNPSGAPSTTSVTHFPSSKNYFAATKDCNPIGTIKNWKRGNRKILSYESGVCYCGGEELIESRVGCNHRWFKVTGNDAVDYSFTCDFLCFNKVFNKNNKCKSGLTGANFNPPFKDGNNRVYFSNGLGNYTIPNSYNPSNPNPLRFPARTNAKLCSIALSYDKQEDPDYGFANYAVDQYNGNPTKSGIEFYGQEIGNPVLNTENPYTVDPNQFALAPQVQCNCETEENDAFYVKLFNNQNIPIWANMFPFTCSDVCKIYDYSPTPTVSCETDGGFIKNEEGSTYGWNPGNTHPDQQYYNNGGTSCTNYCKNNWEAILGNVEGTFPWGTPYKECKTAYRMQIDTPPSLYRNYSRQSNCDDSGFITGEYLVCCCVVPVQ